MSNINKPSKNNNRNSIIGIMWAVFIAFVLICIISIVGIVLINVFNVPILKLNHFDTKIDTVDAKVNLVNSKVDLVYSSSDEEVDIIDEKIRTVDGRINEINSQIEDFKLNNNDLKSGSDVDKGVESTLLATGLAIIGLAISVWAGLNIINAIDRNELNNLIKLSEKKSRYFDKKLKENTENFKELKKNATEIEGGLKRTESSFITAMNTNFKSAFIKELKNADNDILTMRLYKEFSEKFCVVEKNIYNDKWCALLEIEQLFCQVYDLHTSAYKANWGLIEKADMGIKKSNELLKSENDELIKKYLNCRIADFYFYKGYCQTSEAKFNSFYTSAKMFSDIFKEIIPKFKQVEFETKDLDKELCCYICNTIGEAYRKIIERPDKVRGCYIDGILVDEIIEDVAEKAVFYCKCSIEFLDYKKVNEVYFRNYGCALECRDRVNNKDDQFNEDIYKAYNDALIAAFDERISLPNKRWYSVYYVNASYLHRIFKAVFKCNSVAEYDELVSNTSEFAGKYTELIDYMLQITEMAIQSYPNAKAYISLRGFACCYKMFALLAKKTHQIRKKKIYMKTICLYLSRFKNWSF